MATPPDLSLPPTAPVERYRNEPMSLLPTALYTLVELSDGELHELQRQCESEIPDATPGDNVRFPADTQARFIGSPLRAVYDHHLELGPRHTFDPIYFIVATDKEWKTKGVLLVTLDDGSLDEAGCSTDSFFIKAAEAGLTVSNLQVGNSDWSEEKESCEMPRSGHDNDDDDDHDDDNDESDSSDSGPDPPPAHIKHIDTFAPLYVISGIDAGKLIHKLEPGSSRKKNPETDYMIRWQATLTPQTPSPPDSSNPMVPPDPTVTADLVAQACARHARRCRKNPRLNRTRLLVADTPHYGEHGLVLVHLAWDKGVATPAHHQRIPAEEYAGFQQRYLDAACLHRRPKHPLVVVVEPGVGTEGHAMAGRQALDPAWRTRGEHDKRVVYAPPRRVVPGRVNEKIRWEDLDEAARWFPWVCRTRRFDEALVRGFFVWVDHAELAAKGTVVVVRVDWDGDVHRSDEELLALDLDGKVTKLRVPAGEALDLIETATTRGNIEGLSNEVVESCR